jgi:acyl-coenzyme A thioesterase PaaI-like protein
MDAATLQATLDRIAADYVKRLQLRVETVAPGEVTLTMPVLPEFVHGGGVLCGQAIMSAADTAMLLAMIAQLGEFRPMTTVQLQTSCF